MHSQLNLSRDCKSTRSNLGPRRAIRKRWFGQSRTLSAGTLISFKVNPMHWPRTRAKSLHRKPTSGFAATAAPTASQKTTPQTFGAIRFGKPRKGKRQNSAGGEWSLPSGWSKAKECRSLSSMEPKVEHGSINIRGMKPTQRTSRLSMVGCFGALSRPD